MVSYNLIAFEEALNLLTEMSKQEFDTSHLASCLCCVSDG